MSAAESDDRQFSVAEIHEAIAATRPDETCLVYRDRRLTWREITDRTRRLANHLIATGLGCHRERDALANHESGQDHLAIYLHNGNEYMESMLGALKARVAPFNVNYRYVASELHYLLDDAQATAIVVHSRFTPTLAEVLPRLPRLRVILQVADESELPLMAGAIWYEDALAASSPDRPAVKWSPDDLYILYTGGTTGMPKGVLWRNADANIECFGGSRAESLAGIVAEAVGDMKALLSPPFMHGAGHWMALRTWNLGGTLHIQWYTDRLDPHDIWSMIERERSNFLLIVGDAFGRPLLDQLAEQQYDLSSLTVVLSGGAALSAPLKDELLTHLPTVLVIDGLGSSEAGGQLTHVSSGSNSTSNSTTGTFPSSASSRVLSEDLSHELLPGDTEIGWLAKTGRLALGYLGDPDKTARTYPIVDGVRYAVPGDRARLRADDVVELLGRDSVTINSGGEKIFAEEVEAAVKAHPAVYDCVVAGRVSERWGNEVVAIVRLRKGHQVDDEGLRAVAERHIARYKLPKSFVYVAEIVRSPAGKADYRWAKQIAASAPG
ncbi:MAG: acyl-CoA synthetase [Actinobacteria bacterium]|nr:acyl-CoA synthetase [Actinomycetota bacterium]